VHLLAKRLKISGRIGQEKKAGGRPVQDRNREAVVLEHVRTIADREGISPDEVSRLYEMVIAASSGMQGIEVAFQGEAGAYSEQAALDFFGQFVVTRPCPGLDEVFKLVQEGRLSYGMVPVENSLEGSVTRSYDLLLDCDVRVCGELELRISHCLIANKGARRASIKRVYSHPQALAQCQGFLRKSGYEQVAAADTAGSVNMIKQTKLMDSAAIASARAAGIYGMKILASGIEDNERNYTRFLVLSHQDAAPTGNDKTSVVFMLKHRPGTLYEALRGFSSNRINLTRIESRPTRLQPWEYNFYVDFEGHRQEEHVKSALAGLEEVSLFLKVLGSYPRAKLVRGGV
jgi:chorismate mutase/prephenate dehydratase